MRDEDLQLLTEGEDGELLVELVTLPHWKVLRKVIGERLIYLHAQMRQPARVFPDDFYKREQLASAANELDSLVRSIEAKAERETRRHSVK